MIAANPGVNIDALRPYLGYNSIRETDNVASSRYNSLQVSWNKRFSKGVLFGVSYTLSKSMDDGSNQRDIIPDMYDAHNLWGPSEFDARHVFISNFLYDLPLLKANTSWAGKLLGGWQVSGIFQAQTGTPCSIGAGNDYAHVGQDGSFGCGNAGQFWVENGSISYPRQFAYNGSKQANYWFATTSSSGAPIFTAPPAGTFNLQNGIRDNIYNPGFNNWNLGCLRSSRSTSESDSSSAPKPTMLSIIRTGTVRA